MNTSRHILIHLIKAYFLHFRNPQWQDYLLMAEEGMLHEDICGLLISSAKEDAKIVDDKGLYLWRPPVKEELYAEGKADIPIGQAIENDLEIGLRITDRPRNILLTAGAGSGKTVLCRRICLETDRLNQSQKKPTCLVIFDLKSDFVTLKNQFITPTLLLSPDFVLRLGLNAPAQVPASVWINKISLILAGRLGMIVARTTLMGLVMTLLILLNPGLKEADLNSHCSQTLIWPPLSLVLKAAQTDSILNTFSSKAAYGQTLRQLLLGLIQDAGPLLDCCNGFDINPILDSGRHCLVHLNSVPPHIAHIIFDILAAQRMIRKQYTNYKCDHTDEIFLIDEYDLMAESDLQNFPDGLSTQELIGRLGREMGIMSVISMSGSRYASHHIKRNTCYTFCFNQSDADSARIACQELQLDPRCSRLLSSLPPGECIFRQTQSLWTNALWCRINFVPPERDFTSLAYDSHPFVPAPDEIQSQKIIDALIQLCARSRPSEQMQIEKTAMHVLKLRAEHPYLPVVRLYEKIGKVHFKVQENVRQYLADRHLAAFEETRIGRVNLLLMDILPEGFGKLGLAPPSGNRGRGSIIHRHFAHWIKDFYESQKANAFIEWTLPGTNHPADVAVESKNHWQIFEISVSAKENLLQQIQACFEACSIEIERLVFVVATRKEAADLKTDIMAKIAGKAYAGKIRFDTIDHYMTERLKK